LLIPGRANLWLALEADEKPVLPEEGSRIFVKMY
jgi:hypothetical protein